jgi:sugar lactone lactonase YvrE
MRRGIVLALAAAVGGLSPAADQEPESRLYGYRADPAWPRKPSEIAWGEVSGVTVDRDDNVWIYNRASPAVQVYSPAGDLVKTWPEVPQKRAHHIRLGPDGNVWLVDAGAHTVTEYSPDGKKLLQLGTPGVSGEDARTFNQPTDVAITPAGELFVSDGYGNNRIVHFDRKGTFVKTWGKRGTAPGEFQLPHAIALDSKGLLYVADRSNGRIQVFRQSGEFVAEWRDLLVPWGLWITAKDEIWACGSTPMEIASERGLTATPCRDQVFMKFDPSGRVVRLWCPPLGTLGKETRPGELLWVHALAPDSKGNLYAVDIHGHKVQKFTPVR